MNFKLILIIVIINKGIQCEQFNFIKFVNKYKKHKYNNLKVFGWADCFVEIRDLSNSVFEIAIDVFSNPKNIDSNHVLFFLNSVTETSYQCLKKDVYFDNDKCAYYILESLNDISNTYFEYIKNRTWPNFNHIIDMLKNFYNIKTSCVDNE